MQSAFTMKEYIDKIKEAHYKDLDGEHRLCEELLAYSEADHNAYGKGFAYVYLVDYYVAVHDTAGGFPVLKAALEFHADHEFLELQMRLFNLAGIFYGFIRDDFTAFEYFLKSLELAEASDDFLMRYRLYNNIAVGFHNKNDCETALPYYRRAYHYLNLSSLDRFDTQYRLYLLQNMINCSIVLDSKELLVEFYSKLEQLYADCPQQSEDASVPWQKAVVLAYLGKKEEAYEILSSHLHWEKNPLNASEIIELYPRALELLLEWKEKALAEKVLDSLCYYLERESVQARQEACSYRIRFYETFGMEDQLADAYKCFYKVSLEVRVLVEHSQVRAMKEKLQLFEVQQRLNQLKKISYMDDLCGLYNRRYYTEHLERVMKESVVRQLGIIILDIDHFKEYNDYYGHNSGDMVLKKVALCLQEEAGSQIIPCRYGGDEFCCICEDIMEKEIDQYLKSVFKKLEKLAIAHLKSRIASRVTLSAGYSVEPMEGLDRQNLFHEADEALYRAKTRGKNRACSYHDDCGEAE